MYVEKVRLHNIDKLFEIAAYNLEQQEMVGKTYERNIVELYNQMSIALEVKMMSLMEYFHMKFMLQEGSLQVFDFGFRMEYINSVYSDISQDIRQFKRISKYDTFREMIPAACYDGSTVITLTGKDLAMIFGADPMREFFVKVIPEDKLYDERHKFNRKYTDEIFKDGEITDKELEEKFINPILSAFYTSLIRNYEYIDVLSDFSLQRFFTDDVIKIIYVNDFDIEASSLVKKLEAVKGKLGCPWDEISLTFSLYTDFATFLTAYADFPKRCFTAIESLRVPHAILNNAEYYETLNKAENDIVETLRTTINDCYGIKGKEIPYSLLIPGNAKIHYIMKLTLRDINTYISRLQFATYGLYTQNIYDTVLQFGRLINDIVTK